MGKYDKPPLFPPSVSYEFRLVVPTERTLLQRRLIISRARAVLRRVEQTLFKPTQLVAARQYSRAEHEAINAKARELLAFTPPPLPSHHDQAAAPKKYSLAERRAIVTRARALLECDRNSKKLQKLIDKLRQRTIRNGCTAGEEREARAAIHRLLKVKRNWSDR
jgi:hypothetical protein